jgi:transposase
MRAYSEDLRQRVVGAVERGEHPEEVAQTFEVSLASVKRFVKQKRERGHLHSRRPRGRPRTLSAEHERVLVEQVKMHNKASLEEHAARLVEATGQQVSAMTIQRTLLRLGITRKKDETA